MMVSWFLIVAVVAVVLVVALVAVAIAVGGSSNRERD